MAYHTFGRDFERSISMQQAHDLVQTFIPDAPRIPRMGCQLSLTREKDAPPGTHSATLDIANISGRFILRSSIWPRPYWSQIFGIDPKFA